KYVHVDHRIITGIIDRLSNKNSASEWLRWMIDDVLADLTGQEKQYPPPRDALSDLRELGKLYAQAVFDCTPYTDLFGLIYMDLASRSTKSGLGQFFTPQVVTDMMAKMVGHQAKLPKDRLLTCLEPCCGSGVMLLSFARQIYADHGPGGLSRCGLYAIDLDITCCCMTAA
ncbi:N-6 DNA methylase, partial [Thiolapillus sp.]